MDREGDVQRLRVPTTFQLPHLGDVEGVTAVVPAPSTSGTSTVVDTDALDLARWGVRLVHDGTAWELELPPHPAGVDVAPTHHRLRTSSRTIPAAARSGLTRLVGERELERVARLTVRRRAVGLLVDGEVAHHVSDEEVSVRTGRRLSGRFREVVVQPGPAATGRSRKAVLRALRTAGALELEEQPREVRILGPAAVSDPDLPDAPEGDHAGAAWRTALVAGLRELLVADVHLRLDTTGAVAGPTLDVLDRLAGLVELLDADAAARSGLATLRSLCDDVDRTRARAASLDEGLAGPRDRARQELDVAVRALHRHQDGEDHAAAVVAVRRLARDPGLAEDEAAAPVRDSVARRVDKVWTPLAAALEADDPGAAASLAALAAGAAVADGKGPARFARAAGRAAAAARTHARARGVQRWLAEVAAGLEPEEAFRTGHLAGRRVGEAEAAAQEWASALARLTRDKATGWLQ